MPFADKLRELRSQADLTQEALARAAGLSLSVIRDYEQGKTTPTLGSAIKLARALGTTCEVFAECVDAPARPSPAKKAAGKKGRRNEPEPT